MSLPAKQALKLITKNASNAHFKIIDVRTTPERYLSSIPNSQHIPLDQVTRHLHSLSKDNTYLIYCRSGKRSLEATNLMKLHGINAINMEGGIIQWQKLTNKQQTPTGNSQGQNSSSSSCTLI